MCGPNLIFRKFAECCQTQCRVTDYLGFHKRFILKAGSSTPHSSPILTPPWLPLVPLVNALMASSVFYFC